MLRLPTENTLDREENIMAEQFTTLASITVDGKGSYGIGASAVPFSKDLYTYLRITDIKDDGTLNLQDLKSVDDEKASEYLLKPNDIVFARTGASTGRNYFYDGTDGEFVYAGFLIKFSIDEKKVNPKYIKYFCQSKQYKDWINSFNTGSTRGNINAQTLGKMPIPLIERTAQDALVSILSSIDEKIKKNNEINNNLFEQMQALYKAWFVDFEPFGGVRPSNWNDTNIYAIANIIYGAPFASKLFNTDGLGKPIIRIRDLKEQAFVTFTTEEHPKGHLIQPADIVVGMDGEFRPYIWGNEPAWLNQRVCIFESNRPQGKAFVLYTIKPLLNKIEQTQVATTVIHIGKKDFDAFEIILPDEATLDSFDSITAPMIEQIVNNRLLNKRLAVLRDTLLPKLMSGELDVSNIEL